MNRHTPASRAPKQQPTTVCPLYKSSGIWVRNALERVMGSSFILIPFGMPICSGLSVSLLIASRCCFFREAIELRFFLSAWWRDGGGLAG